VEAGINDDLYTLAAVLASDLLAFKKEWQAAFAEAVIDEFGT